MLGVRQAGECPHSSDLFIDYVEDVYLPFVGRTMKPSTYAGHKSYFERYLKPRVGKYALRDFTVATVAGLLKDIASTHQVNRDTISKVRLILSGIFTYAMSEGHFPARSKRTIRHHAPAFLNRRRSQSARLPPHVRRCRLFWWLSKECLWRAPQSGSWRFVACVPGEARGMRCEEWNRAEKDIAVNRGNVQVTVSDLCR
jgi:hypothetical protein